MVAELGAYEKVTELFVVKFWYLRVFIKRAVTLTSAVWNDELLRSGHWSGSMLRVTVSALTWMKRHLADRNQYD